MEVCRRQISHVVPDTTSSRCTREFSIYSPSIAARPPDCLLSLSITPLPIKISFCVISPSPDRSGKDPPAKVILVLSFYLFLINNSPNTSILPTSR